MDFLAGTLSVCLTFQETVGVLQSDCALSHSHQQHVGSGGSTHLPTLCAAGLTVAGCAAGDSGILLGSN